MDSTVLYSYRMLSLKKSEAEFEKFDSIAADIFGKYVVVVSSMGREGLAKDLVWLQVNKKSGAIHRLARKTITEEYSYFNERKSLIFYGYVYGFPVVFTCERFGKGQMHSYYFDGKEIQTFLRPMKNFSTDDNYRIYFKDQHLFFLDLSGRLIKYNLFLSNQMVADTKYFQEFESVSVAKII
jgi:hypothetical protein